jgi:hypothetical protein
MHLNDIEDEVLLFFLSTSDFHQSDRQMKRDSFVIELSQTSDPRLLECFTNRLKIRQCQ